MSYIKRYQKNCGVRNNYFCVSKLFYGGYFRGKNEFLRCVQKIIFSNFILLFFQNGDLFNFTVLP